MNKTNKKILLGILEDTLDGYWYMDIPEGEIYFSPACKAVFGYLDHELPNNLDSLNKIVHTEDYCKILDLYNRHIESNGLKPLKAEVRCTSKDGSIIWIYSTGKVIQWLDSKKPKLIVGTNINITNRKEAEEFLKNSNITAENTITKLSKAVEQSPATIIITSPEGKIEYANPQATKVTGYEINEILGKNPRILKSGEQPEEFYINMWETISSGETWHGNFHNKRKNGDLYWESALISPIFNKKHEITNYIAIKEDITQKKQLEEDLIKAKEQAELANKSKSDFLANMSHEIRTPMNGIIGMTSLILDTCLDKEQEHFAKTIQKSSQDLLNLINDILDFSKIEAGKMELEIIEFNIYNLIEDLMSLHNISVKDKNIKLLCNIDESIPSSLRGDPGKIRQVLTNLLSNAIKFTSKGNVSLRVNCKIEISEIVSLEFHIKDTGIGISEPKQKLLFNKFTQVDSSTTREYGGTGLGLAISKQLTELMDGQIGVSSKEGYGSEFWFSIPFKTVSSPLKADTSQQKLDELRLLIVDDNPDNREILTKMFNSWGIITEEASDGPSALLALYKGKEMGKPFDIGVFDMKMPRMTGEALARTIKSDDSLKSIKLVLLTSMPIRGDAKRMKDLFSAYLIKPVKEDELKKTISILNLDNEPKIQEQIITRHSIKDMKQNELKILLIEDNLINQKVALGLLKKLGFSADTADDGKQGIIAIEQKNYDLVFMDIQMPDLDGYEATRIIRNWKNTKSKTIIIAMTANAMQGDREKCIEAGMNDYISKPITLENLSRIITKWGEDQDTNVDFNYNGIMTSFSGDLQLINELVEYFIEQVPSKIKNLKEAVNNEDLLKAKNISHNLKGAFANLNTTKLYNLATKLEILCAENNIEESKSLLENIDLYLESAILEIKNKLGLAE